MYLNFLFFERLERHLTMAGHRCGYWVLSVVINNSVAMATKNQTGQ